MALRPAPFLLLVLVAVVLRESCFGAFSHSLKYFSSAISEPSQGQPHFVTVGYVDGQVFVRYDSHSRRMQPRVSWMKKEKPTYWDRETQRELGNEDRFRAGLETLRIRYNQSEGLHTWQWMYGCELQADGRKGGFDHHGYDGRTFIAFDKERLTWVAPQPQAQITQRKWDAIPGYNQRHKSYLEEICIEWLQKYLSDGKETLLRTEPPEVTVSRRTEVEDGMETHVCRLHGFYPREIEASWRRDGEVWLQDTLRGSMAPNADGTFHAWLSIQIDPKERGRYRCHVEHDGLQEPLDVALKEPKSNLGLIIDCIVAVLVLLGVMVGIYVFFKRHHEYKKAQKPKYNLRPFIGNIVAGFISVCVILVILACIHILIPESYLGLIGCVVAGLVLLGVFVVGILVFFKRRQDDYKKAEIFLEKPFRKECKPFNSPLAEKNAGHLTAPL